MSLPAQGYLHEVQAQSLKLLSIPTLRSSFDRYLLTHLRSQSMASWVMVLFYGVPPTQPVFSPAGLFWQGSRGPLRFSLHSQERPLVLALVLALSSRSFDRWYVTHWRSFAALSAGYSTNGTSRTSARPGAVYRADDIPTLWQMIVGFPFNLGHLHIQTSSPWLLLWYWGCLRTLLTGDILHTGALRSALSRRCLGQ